MLQFYEYAAIEKKRAVEAKIPPEWKLAGNPSSEEHRKKYPNVTNDYIRQYLDAEEIKYTETDAIVIHETVCSGQWKATDVAKAFCHRAAIAHQLVCSMLRIKYTPLY